MAGARAVAAKADGGDCAGGDGAGAGAGGHGGAGGRVVMLCEVLSIGLGRPRFMRATGYAQREREGL